MGRSKYDGVVEAVHYKPDGQVEWVRTFLRRGPTWSDFVLLQRQDLIEQMKSGKKFMVGKRIPQLASTFEVTIPLRLVEQDGKELVMAGDATANQDCLEGVPVI